MSDRIHKGTTITVALCSDQSCWCWAEDRAKREQPPALTSNPMIWSAQFECSECKAKHNVACSQPYFKVLEFQCLRCHATTMTDKGLARETTACNHDLQSREKTLKATGAPNFGWRCTVCAAEWFPEKSVAEPELEPIYVAGPGTPIIGHRAKPSAPAATSLATPVPDSSTGTAAGAVPTCTKHGVELAFEGDECWACKEDLL